MPRLLLDPAAEAAGGAPPTPEPKPADPAKPDRPAPAAPAPDRNAPAKPARVEVDPAYLADLHHQSKSLAERLAAVEAEQAAKAEAEREAHLRQLAEKEGAVKALETQREQLRQEQARTKAEADRRAQEIESRLTAERQAELDRLRGESGSLIKQLEAERDRYRAEADSLRRNYLGEKVLTTVNDGMSGRTWIDDVAERDARKKLAERFEPQIDKDGNVVVIDRETKKPAAEVVASILDSRDFAYFQPPKSRGGSGATTAATGREATTLAPGDPKAAVLNRLKEAVSRQQNGVIGLVG